MTVSVWEFAVCLSIRITKCMRILLLRQQHFYFHVELIQFRRTRFKIIEGRKRVTNRIRI